MNAEASALLRAAAGGRHWRLAEEAGGPAWLWLDKAESATNTLSRAVMDELEEVLGRLEAAPPRALIIASAKPAGFIAGADVSEFEQLDSATAARALVTCGWALFERVAALPFPTLALIRGHCLGGGLELALACRYRLVVDDKDTRLALPEVMLGIVPGWGGMKRLPTLIGPLAALDMMLAGKSVDARRAKRLGLADDCVPARVMENAARMLVLSGQPLRQPSLLARLLDGPLKPLIASRARKQLAARVRAEHYPAPYAILEIWERHGGNALAVPAGHPASLEALIASPTTRKLLRVFFLQERLKGYGKESGFAPRHVHVVGAGVMGGDIAAVCVLAGLTVTLQDQSVARIAPAIGRAAELFRRKLGGGGKSGRGKGGRGKGSRSEDTERAVRFALDRLLPDPQGHGVARADLMIEAIFEDLEAKRSLFAELERKARPDALLATNTSSLRLEDIATALTDPGRLVGIHFFNPVPRMPLVEVVSGAQTAPALAQAAASFVRRIDKLPLPVKSAPGFLVNAVLAPYMLEALRCVEEGIAPETVDAALLAFGMPMGPVELVDTVGLDVALAAGRGLTGGEAQVPARLAMLVEAGHLGRKTGQGYYRWKEGRAEKSAPATHAAEGAPVGLAERIIAPLLAAARRCVAEKVVADADLADAGVIFGTGFAPYTGGPLQYLEDVGEFRIAGRAALQQNSGVTVQTPTQEKP